ncbi:MAG TPA: ABC transporter permease [Gemmataceae bacterium]|nr:ABC transporter permease [Gemmataceae bacterium]
MTWIAIKMLTGDPAKYLGIIAGVTFAALLIAQQASIAIGLLLRTTAHIQDIADVDIWVMDPNVQFIDEFKPLPENDLYRVQSVPGVAWAVRLYKGQGRLKLSIGGDKKTAKYQQSIVLGLDDATMVGAPRRILVGSLADLRKPDAVIIDEIGYRYVWPNEPLAVGRELEMNDHRAVIVGICEASDTFNTFPIFYCRYHQAIRYVPQERKVMSAILVGAEEGVSHEEVCRRITEQTRLKPMKPGDPPRPGLKALTRDQFLDSTIMYFIKRTGIVINFSITIFLGFLVGCAIAGQTFYTFTLENLPQFGSLKAMGVTNLRLVGMVLTQALLVGLLGYGLGVGGAALFGKLMTSSGSRLAFLMPWQVLAGTGAAVAFIVTLSSLVSVYKVLVLEPAVVFRG